MGGPSVIEVSVPLASENRTVPPVTVVMIVVVWGTEGKLVDSNVKVPVN
jgi:hypothetical protein